MVWTHYSVVEPHSSNFRVITTNVLGVQIFRKFTIGILTSKDGLIVPFVDFLYDSYTTDLKV